MKKAILAVLLTATAASAQPTDMTAFKRAEKLSTIACRMKDVGSYAFDVAQIEKMRASHDKITVQVSVFGIVPPISQTIDAADAARVLDAVQQALKAKVKTAESEITRLNAELRN